MKRKRLVKVAEVGQIPPAEMKAVTAHGQTVVLVNLEDSYFAFDGRCPHKGGPLAQGSLWDGTIQCPWHRHRYDVRTGQNVYPKNVYPSDMPWLLEQVGSLQMYAVKVEGRDILLEEPGSRKEVIVQPQEIKQYVGQKVRVQLSPQAHQGPAVIGRLIGTLDAADGLVVQIEPDGSKSGARLTIHYHHILSLTPEASGP